jgi:hypothetical protein
MKAPYIKLNGQYYLVNGFQFHKGTLHYISYMNGSRVEIAWDSDHDLQTLLKEGEQHECVS